MGNNRLRFSLGLDTATTQHNDATARTLADLVASRPISVRIDVNARSLWLPIEEDDRARLAQEVATKSSQLLPRCSRRRTHASAQFLCTVLGVSPVNSDVVTPGSKSPVSSSRLPRERHIITSSSAIVTPT